MDNRFFIYQKKKQHTEKINFFMLYNFNLNKIKNSFDSKFHIEFIKINKIDVNQREMRNTTVEKNYIICGVEKNGF